MHKLLTITEGIYYRRQQIGKRVYM